eukprot:30299_5
MRCRIRRFLTSTFSCHEWDYDRESGTGAIWARGMHAQLLVRTCVGRTYDMSLQHYRPDYPHRTTTVYYATLLCNAEKPQKQGRGSLEWQPCAHESNYSPAVHSSRNALV